MPKLGHQRARPGAGCYQHAVGDPLRPRRKRDAPAGLDARAAVGDDLAPGADERSENRLARILRVTDLAGAADQKPSARGLLHDLRIALKLVSVHLPIRCAAPRSAGGGGYAGLGPRGGGPNRGVTVGDDEMRRANIARQPCPGVHSVGEQGG